MRPAEVTMSDHYISMVKQHEQKAHELTLENERLRHFLPDSYTEMRLRERQL
jgi:hypothetical protein